MRYAILALLALSTTGLAQESDTLYLSPIKTTGGRTAPAIGQSLPQDGGTLNYGIDPARLRANQPGFQAKTEEAKRFVAEATVGRTEDSAEKLHVTVIGQPADRDPVLKDFRDHPAYANIRDTINLQGYSPDDWEVDSSLGYMHGKPTILVQNRSGRVLWRAMDYSAGPEGVATAIRRASPNYDPSLDPGPNDTNDDMNDGSNSACPFGFGPRSWPLIGLAAVVILLILKQPRSQ